MTNALYYLSEFRNVHLTKINRARDYELFMQRKSVLLIAQFLARSKGGGAASL